MHPLCLCTRCGSPSCPRCQREARLPCDREVHTRKHRPLRTSHSDGASSISARSHGCFADALAPHMSLLYYDGWIGIAVGPMQPLPAQTDWRGHRDPCLLLCLQKPDAVETAVKEAEEKCASGTSGECAAAWDNVSVLSSSRDQQQKTLWQIFTSLCFARRLRRSPQPLHTRRLSR